MNKETMQQLIKEGLQKKLGDNYTITVQKVFKPNVKLDGLIILKEGDTVSPTIYLNPFYSMLKNEKSISAIVDEIVETYFYARAEYPAFDTGFITDFNKVKDKLFVKLINKHLNKELLENVPHLSFLDDFAVTVHCLIYDNEYFSSFSIHNNLLKELGIDKQLLISTAIDNTRKLFGLNLKNMKDVIKELQPECDFDDSPINMWVMTNTSKHLGATAVLFEDVLKNFSSMFGNFYVIFSSIHEALLIPAPDNSDIDFFSNMNAEVNNTEVAPDEVLGNKAYYYDAQKGFVF